MVSPMLNTVMEQFKTVYFLRRAFLANCILFTLALAAALISSLIGSEHYFWLASMLFTFHAVMSVSALGILRFLPKPD